jgi:hypothetical protein
MVEFALVAPILFLLLFSIVEFGRFIYYSNVLNDATREGSRYAIVHGSDATCKSGPLPGGPPPPINSCDPTGQRVIDTVRRFAVGVIPDADFQIFVCWGTPDPVNPESAEFCNQTNNGRGQPVRVTLDYQFKSLVPMVPLPTIPMHAESTLVIQH